MNILKMNLSKAKKILRETMNRRTNEELKIILERCGVSFKNTTYSVIKAFDFMGTEKLCEFDIPKNRQDILKERVA